MRLPVAAALAAALALIPPVAPAQVALFEDFDGGGIGSTFAFTNSSGTAASVVDLSPLPATMAARITSLSSGNKNSIAFDQVGIQGAQVILSFKFRMSDDTANANAGGCCGEAADGFGIGLFDTATYGATGASDPGSGGEQQWEDPTASVAFPAALVLGFDVFTGGDGAGNTLRLTGLTGPGELLHNGEAPFPLNNNLFNSARLSAIEFGTDALLSLSLVEDVNGVATPHEIFNNLLVPGLDLATVNARLIAGGRTGAAFVQTELDDIQIEVVQSADGDMDNLPDYWEAEFGVDDPDANDDGDQLTNLQEYQRGTNPNLSDTDGDGLFDHVETGGGSYSSPTDTGTNPLVFDTDGDGLRDGVETNDRMFDSPTDTGSDPNNPNTDGDPFNDGEEVAAGTDPNDPNSFPTAPIVLGTGTGALLGGDLTDPKNDGAADADAGYNAVFAASEEASFGAGEAAFNVFDNRIGPSNDKWCCGQEGGDFPNNPIWVSATFPEAYRLTHFTISSANDTPERDPREWEIQGSNDGVNFDTIYRQDNTGTSVWGDTRDQVLRFNAGIHFAPPDGYTTFRFICFATGLSSGARYQLSEIELFGEAGPAAPLAITDVRPSGNSIEFTWNSRGDRTYTLSWSTDLENWTEIIDNFTSGGDSTTYTYVPNAGDPPADPTVTPAMYFRVAEDPPPPM